MNRERTRVIHMDIGNTEGMPFFFSSFFGLVLQSTNARRAKIKTRLFFSLMYFLTLEVFFFLFYSVGFLLIFCLVSNDLTLVIIGRRARRDTQEKNGEKRRTYRFSFILFYFFGRAVSNRKKERERGCQT